MADVPPDLAAKVVAADVRNIIADIGSGGKLTEGQREMFMDFARQGGPADELAAERTNALLRKWLGGGRLTPEEKAEISHVLPAAPQHTEPRATYEGTAEEIAATMGLKRKTFFTWKKHGETHGDPLPVGDPAAVPAWYERMMTRQVFKHKIDAKVKNICLASKGKPPPAAPAPSAPAVAGNAPAPQAPPSANTNNVSRFMQMNDNGPTGVGVEIVALEKRIAATRLAMDDAYATGQQTEAERLGMRLGDMLESLTKLKRADDNDKLIEDRIKRAVEEDLASYMPAIVSNLLFMGARLYPKLRSELPRQEFIALFRGELVQCFSGLRQCKFAPALEGDLMKALLT